MLSDWLKTQKKPPRINQIRAVLITKFGFCTQNNNRKVKNIFQEPEYSQKYVFLAKCIENAVLREKYRQGKIEENDSLGTADVFPVVAACIQNFSNWHALFVFCFVFFITFCSRCGLKWDTACRPTDDRIHFKLFITWCAGASSTTKQYLFSLDS